MFSLARKSLYTYRNAFKNTFPLNGKIKLAVAEVSQNGSKKNGRKSVSISRNQVNFKKSLGLHKQKKTLSKGILFQIDRKSVFTSGNGEFV